MTSKRRQLVALIERGAIADGDIRAAVRCAGLHPSAREWRDFLDRTLLWLGSLALACSVLFFIAYHWADMGRLWRFALVQGCLVAAIAVHWRAGGRGMVAQAALMAAALLLGGLLALFGQVYQTGADTWQLFFTWALLLLPWVLLGRQVALWVLWLVLCNLAILLYHRVWGGVFGALLGLGHPALWSLFVFNTLALIVWELGALRWPWLAAGWPRRLLALGGGVPMTLLTLDLIGGHRASPGVLWLLYPLWLAALYVVYRRWRVELFMLAGGCLSAISVIAYLLANALFPRVEAGGLLLMAAVILGLSSLAVVWLKRVYRETGA